MALQALTSHQLAQILLTKPNIPVVMASGNTVQHVHEATVHEQELLGGMSEHHVNFDETTHTSELEVIVLS